MSGGYVLEFSDNRANARELAGGKGANLAALTQAGFPVPPGFCVTAQAHAHFLDVSGIEPEILQLEAKIDYSDPAQLEEITSQIRDLVATAPVPAQLAAEIRRTYTGHGGGQVAVRSSGISEDSAEASFAGLHDTLLDVAGPEDVVDAVRGCWASAWSGRATTYRHNKDLPSAARLAVVVQRMVQAQVAGVMFTGNPMTADAHEIVINASWGLGESVVSGHVTPDLFVVAHDDLRIKERTLGEKARQVVRNQTTDVGVMTEDVPAADRARYCLDDAQISQLAALGRRVQEHYGDLPQDTEWAIADRRVYLLQSRPITGTEFTWAGDLDEWQTGPDDDDWLWTREWADAYQSGAVSPLFYTIRSYTCTAANQTWSGWLGVDEAAKMRNFKFHRSTVYFNCEVDRVLLRETTPPVFRAGLADMIPPAWKPETLAAPFGYASFLKQHARLEAMTPNGLLRWFGVMENYMTNEVEHANGLPSDELVKLSDRELRRYCDRYVEYERTYLTDAWAGFMSHGKEMMSLLGLMIMKWYSEGSPAVFGEVVAGSVKTTATQVENNQLWALAGAIRDSEQLRALFEQQPGAAFFDALTRNDSEAGRDAAAQYAQLLLESGHRGSSDRDMAFPTRSEDPSNDYAALKALLTAPVDADPARREHEVNARREELLDRILTDIRRRPFGGLKAEAFKFVHGWVMRFNAVRDDERHFFDRFMFTIRRGFLEVGRRLVEDGVFEGADDVFYLGREELWELMLVGKRTPLVEAKLAARRRDFERFDRKEYLPPLYLRRGRPADTHAGVLADSGGLTGIPVSSGAITGTARCVRSLSEIGTVSAGEILIVNATDPAWTSVFLIVSGVIVETGGMLSHAACLAREYGLPAVQLPNALQKIENGATITVQGDTGVITVHDK